MQLHWKTNPWTSTLHAARAVADNELPADSPWVEAIREPVSELNRCAEEWGLPVGRLWDHLLALSAGVDPPRTLAERALAKVAGTGVAAERAGELARPLQAIASAYRRAAPEVGAHLPLRLPMLREQWEARGPGMLRVLMQLTTDELLPDEATVVLVNPVRGGFGAAYGPYNLVCWEAVLADVEPRLPEVARLGWLLAQLNLDLPGVQDIAGRDNIERVGPLALIPAALAAAAEVELTSDDAGTLELAVVRWGGQSSATARSIATTLAAWWETYQASRPPWAIALAACGEAIEEGRRS